jgi:hypothetical protein
MVPICGLVDHRKSGGIPGGNRTVSFGANRLTPTNYRLARDPVTEKITFARKLILEFVIHRGGNGGGSATGMRNVIT